MGAIRRASKNAKPLQTALFEFRCQILISHLIRRCIGYHPIWIPRRDDPKIPHAIAREHLESRIQKLSLQVFHLKKSIIRSSADFGRALV